jgi:hypothetical protein
VVGAVARRRTSAALLNSVPRLTMGCSCCGWDITPLTTSVSFRTKSRVYSLPSCRTTCICDGRFCRREINFGKHRRSLRHARCQLYGIFAGEARSLPRCVNGPSAPACELGIFSLSVAEMPQWDAFRKSLDEMDNPAGALS